MTSNNRRIAKNTGLLYIRMLFTMGVSLYTSRVVLNALGVVDFGIYNVVGGVVAMLGFLNGALSSSTSRFLTYELGKKNFDQLKKVFSTTLTIHIALALIILIFAETFGLWFLLNKLVIPHDRMTAALWVYQFSILTCLVSITQVPYNASIIAHEQMNIYAYVSIVEAVLKLLIVYLLVLTGFDKLKAYAVLMFLVGITIAMTYRIYCIRTYSECHYSFQWDKEIYTSIASFSGWSLSGSFTYILLTQGSNILLNMFFGPVVNASRAIAVQVNAAISAFVGNFRMASNPQIVKFYAGNEKQKMKNLVISTTKFSFYLLLFLELPVLLESQMILHIWLGIVPDYALIFMQLTLVDTLITIFDTCLYFVFNAMGRLRENAIISPLIGIWILPVSYVLFKYGFSPVSLFYVVIVKSSILSFIVKPILLYRYAGYKSEDFIKIFLPCVLVTLAGVIPPGLCRYFMDAGWLRLVTICFVSASSVSISVLYLGMDKELRKKIIMMAVSKLNWKKLSRNG